jgi:hypothetical protein
MKVLTPVNSLAMYQRMSNNTTAVAVVILVLVLGGNLAYGQQQEAWVTFDELTPDSPQMQIIKDIFDRVMNGSEQITMILYSDGRVEIRHEDENWRNQDTTIRTVTNYTAVLGYEIRDGIVYSPNGTVLFK